jgi:hypothetical protein
MAVETGNQVQWAYIAEVTFNVTPATPTGKIIRNVGCTLAGDRNYLSSNELRTDRQQAAGRGGVIVGTGDLSGELSYGTFDDFLETALGGTWTTNVLKVGTTRKSFTFERLHKVNTYSFAFKGVVVDNFEISGKADDKVMVKFGLIAATCADPTGATIWTGTTAANTNAIATTWDGSIKKGGVTIGTVTAFSLKGVNNFQQAKVVGNKNLYDLAMGTLKVSGSLDLYFDSYALYTDFSAENAVVLQINLGNGTTTSYTLDLSNCRITKFGAPSQDDGMVSVSVEFESYADATNTALKVTRIP